MKIQEFFKNFLFFFNLILKILLNLDLTLKLSENKNLIPYLLDISKDYKPPQTESIYNLLGQLNEGAKIFSNCIKGGTK